MSAKWLIFSFIVLFLVAVWAYTPLKSLLVDQWLHRADSFFFELFLPDAIPRTDMSEDECQKIGGNWVPLGKSKTPGCQKFSRGLSRVCISGFQCEFGFCEAPEESDFTSVGYGLCPDMATLEDCHTPIYFGIRGTPVCRE